MIVLGFIPRGFLSLSFPIFSNLDFTDEFLKAEFKILVNLFRDRLIT